MLDNLCFISKDTFHFIFLYSNNLSFLNGALKLNLPHGWTNVTTWMRLGDERKIMK